ncbi:transposase [Plantactinospora sp. KBS50]|uniref:transposase n=1 Tax=Plantactinospora sp. KBS50 TaxID=2024580 RepID=UPI001E2B912E|nr:transposase [Plantactinospora sp. KBS50]
MAGSHHPQFVDVLHRSHATVEDQVRHGKAMGLHNLPSKSWTVNQGWVLACNIAADLTAWTRLLGLHDQPDLAYAEPGTLRYRLLHLPAKLATHARRRTLSIPEDWPWATAFTLCWQRLSTLPLTT